MGLPKKERGAGLSPAPLIHLLRCYTNVQVSNTCMHAEESDSVPGAIISIRKLRTNINIAIFVVVATCLCSIFFNHPLF